MSARDELREAAAAAPRLKADEVAAAELERRVAALSEEDFECLAQAVRDASSASLNRQDFARQLLQIAKFGATIGFALA